MFKTRKFAGAILAGALFGGVAGLVPAGVASASTTPGWAEASSASVSSGASSVALSPNGKFLAAEAGNGPAYIYLFAVGSDGSLTAVSGSPFDVGGNASPPDPIAWAPDSEYLAVPEQSTGGSNEITVISVGSGGAMSVVGSADTNAGATYPATDIQYSPNGDYLAVSSANEVYVYQVGSGGVLTLASGSPLAPSYGADALAFSSGGNYLLITSTSYPEVDIYAVGSGGSLTAASGGPVTDISNSGVASISVSPSGDQVALVALANETSGPYSDTIQTGSFSAGSLFFNNMTSVSADTSTVQAVAESNVGNEEAVAGAGIFSSSPSLLGSPAAVTGAMAVSFGPGDILATLSGSGDTVALLVPATTTTATIQPTNPSSGQQVTLTASVNATVGTTVPAGTATFVDGSTTLCSATVTDGSGSCTATLPAGSDTIDVSFTPSSLVGASTATLDAAVNQGSNTAVATDLSGGTMSISAPSSLSFAVTLSGSNQSLDQPVTLGVDDNTGTGDGWNVTVVSTPLETSATTPVVIGSGATVAVNGASSSATATTAPAANDNGSGTYTAPTSNTGVYPLTVPGVHGAISPTPATVYTAAAGSGLGQFNLAGDVWLSVPANALAGNYAGTFTWAIAVGP